MSYKKQIVDTMKRLYTNKFISIRDGNVSFKPKGTDYFYISAGQVKKNEINCDQVLKVHFRQKHDFTNNNTNVTGNYNLVYDEKYTYTPSREIYMHSYLQTLTNNFFSDTFVVHAHPPNIIAYTGLREHRELYNIKLTFPELNVGKIGMNVKYHPAGSYQLANDCLDKLNKNEIVALERHGTLSIGSDVDKIFEDIETLEYYTGVELKENV